MAYNPITPLSPVQEEHQKSQAAHEGYVHRVLVGLDMEANIIADGMPDETISSRASRDAVEGKPFGKVISEVLDVFQHNHGAKAQAGDLERAEVVTKVEEGNGVLPTP